MKFYEFMRKLDAMDLHRECDELSTVDCIAYIPKIKTIVGYPITSITVTSTPKNTRVILNAEYETAEGRNCIKLDQLHDDLKALYGHLDGHERRGSIFMSIKKSKSGPRRFYTIPSWSHPILDLDQDAFFIKATNAFDLK